MTSGSGTSTLVLQAALIGPALASAAWLMLLRWPLARRAVGGVVALGAHAAAWWLLWLTYRGEAVEWRGLHPSLLTATILVAAEIGVVFAAIRAEGLPRGAAPAAMIGLGVSTSGLAMTAFGTSLPLQALALPVPTLAAVLAGLSGTQRGDVRGLLGLAAADALTLVGLTVLFARSGTSTLEPAAGLGTGLLLVGALVKAGAVPFTGTWELVRAEAPSALLGPAIRGQGIALAALAALSLGGGRTIEPLVPVVGAAALVSGLAALLAQREVRAQAAVPGAGSTIPFVALGLGGAVGTRAFLVLFPPLLLAAGAWLLMTWRRPALDEPRTAAEGPQRRRWPRFLRRRRGGRARASAAAADRVPRGSVPQTTPPEVPGVGPPAEAEPTEREAAAPRPPTDAATHVASRAAAPPDEEPPSPASHPKGWIRRRLRRGAATSGGTHGAAPGGGPAPPRGWIGGRRGGAAAPGGVPGGPTPRAGTTDPRVTEATAPGPRVRVVSGEASAERGTADGDEASEGGPAGGEATGFPGPRSLDPRAEEPASGGPPTSRREAPPAPPEGGETRAEGGPETRPLAAPWRWGGVLALGVIAASLAGVPIGGGFPGTWLTLALGSVRAIESPLVLAATAASALGLALALLGSVPILRSARAGRAAVAGGVLAAMALLYAGVQPVRLAEGWWVRIEAELHAPQVLDSAGAPGLPAIGGLNLLLAAAPALVLVGLVVGVARGVREAEGGFTPLVTVRPGVPAWLRRVVASASRLVRRGRDEGLGLGVTLVLEGAALVLAVRLVLLAARAGFL